MIITNTKSFPHLDAVIDLLELTLFTNTATAESNMTSTDIKTRGIDNGTMLTVFRKCRMLCIPCYQFFFSVSTLCIDFLLTGCLVALAMHVFVGINLVQWGNPFSRG